MDKIQTVVSVYLQGFFVDLLEMLRGKPQRAKTHDMTIDVLKPWM